MGDYYTIHGLSHALDGLDVELDPTEYDEKPDDGCVYSILRIRNRTILAGNRAWAVPVTLGGLMVDGVHLTRCDVPDDDAEFATDNPFGEHELEVRFKKGDVEVVCNRYADAVAVACTDTSVDPPRTIYTQNYFGDKREAALRYVEDVVADEMDPDDVAFGLEMIHNGQPPSRDE